jgi:LacI family transcriptional regulator
MADEERMPNQRRVGIRDVAERAGVGLATVSRVLSGRRVVRAELRERVLAAAAELGYEPDILAQSLRRGATRSAGFIADDLSNHLIADIATGAERVLRARGYSLLVMNSEMDRALDPLNIRVLRARRVDALMMAPVSEDDPALVAALRSLDVPLVIVEGDLPGVASASFVVSDHRAGVAVALSHLLDLGHRHVALITGPQAYRSARQRRLGLEDAAAAAPRDARLVHVEAALDAEGGRGAAARLLAGPERPTATVVGGDRLLVGVLEAIGEAGLELGRDVSLVTSDPVPLARVHRPPLAAITRDAPGLGRRAAELLLARLDDPARGPEVVVLPTRYEARGSVGPPPRGAPGVTRGRRAAAAAPGRR